MNGRILYDTVALNQGHADMMNGAGAFDQHQTQWAGVVNETVMAWLSRDGMAFGDVNEMFRQVSLRTNEFLTGLAAGIQRSSMNADETLAYCTNVVRGGA